ncbi:hypothetical protein [Vibrio tapetis]|uniref:DUF4189 domain-containing protein n=1 Tax=Vibrio tapetis subsp. tapetis TaxID=1671868 RepID=A0A2N8ZN24_9VIBR|nr:hypothetical protein [Vibrio tapetis]SON53320.1 conserved exported protein of unknown function [Vibrio tapetis subsp. tapetis]
MKRTIFHILVLATLSGCASVSSENLKSNTYTTEKLTAEMRNDPHSWMKTQFDIYNDSPNNKAFAVYWKGNRALSFAHATNKLDLEKAKTEALRLCNIKSDKSNTCTIDAYSETEEPLASNQKKLPPEVSSYSDLDKLSEFDNTNKHAAVVGNELGILGFSTSDVSQSIAEETATMECLKNTHYSIPTCYIIDSK